MDISLYINNNYSERDNNLPLLIEQCSMKEGRVELQAQSLLRIFSSELLMNFHAGEIFTYFRCSQP